MPKKPTKKPTRKAAPKKATAKALGLHKRALRHNWDDGLFRLDQLLADSACDYGTALLIYWMGAPGYDTQFKTARDCDSWRRPQFVWLRKLQKRLLRREFKTSVILFNPRLDRTTVSSKGHDWTAEYAEYTRKRTSVPIPDALKEPSCPDPAWEARGAKPRKNTVDRLT